MAFNKPLKDYFNSDFLFDYSEVHNSKIYDTFVKDLNTKLVNIAGSNMPNHLLASSSENAKSSTDILKDAFVRKAYDEG